MTKLSAGLDVGDRTTAICVINDADDTCLEVSVPTTPTAIHAALKPYRRRLHAVGLETGTRSSWLYSELSQRRLPVVCLDARYAHAALSAKRNKTDKTDAHGIAVLLARGLFTTVHVRSRQAVRVRLLLNVRKTLQRKALDLQMALRMAEKMFGGNVERRGRKLVRTKAKAKGDDIHRGLSDILHRCSEALLSEVKTLDRLVLQSANSDPVCRQLMTVPGVGPITALSFRAGVDDPKRFKSSRTVAAYFGLTPRRFQSGQTDYSGHISRMGDRAVRTALYTAAQAMLRSKRATPLREWGLALAKRKGKKLANVACARKLAVIMHRMWITERDFGQLCPKHSS